MIEVSCVQPVSLAWKVEHTDRLDFYATIADGPGATALRSQFLIISGPARIGIPLKAGYRLPGKHVYSATVRDLNRRHPRGVFFRYRSDSLEPDHPHDAQMVMFERPLVIQPARGSREAPREVHGALYTPLGTQVLSAPMRIRPWADRFGRPPIWLDYARVIGMHGMAPVDLGVPPPFALDHDPAFRDLQADPTDHQVVNCITTGWTSLPLVKPFGDWWTHEALSTFVALRNVRSRLWRAMIDYLVGKRLTECIDMLIPIPTGEGEDEDGDTTDADGGGGGPGAGATVQAGPCYAGHYTSLRFIGDRFMFEVKRRQVLGGTPHETTLWLLDFPEYGRALRIYEHRADAVAYARGTRTGIADPLFRRVHIGTWEAATDAFLAQYGTPV